MGYEPAYAWMMSLVDEPEVRDIYDEGVATLERRGLTIDGEIPKMMAGRLAFYMAQAEGVTPTVRGLPA